MAWIDQFARSTFNLYAGQVIEGFQPIDFFHFYPLWYDLWVERVASALNTLEADQKSYQELKPILPIPSSLRVQLQKLVPTWQGTSRQHAPAFRTYGEFFARMAAETNPTDPFAETSNRIHSPSEIENMLGAIAWQSGSPTAARLMGQLITAAGSLGHGLFNDLGIDYSWDAYGPYPVTYKGENYTLLIREFTHLRPAELWSAEHLSNVETITLFGLYQNVDWIIPFVGCHASPKSGSIVDGLKHFSLAADGQPLDETATKTLIVDLSTKAEALYRVIRAMNFEALKTKVMEQECYQLKELLTAADMDWRPTTKMLESVKDRPLLEGIIPHGVMMTDYEQYVDVFGIRLFAKEVLDQSLAR